MLGVFVRRLVAILLLAMAPSAVPALTVAHAELISSTPADGETLDEPPREIVITFEGELQPEGSGFRVAGPGGEVATGAVDLQVAERNVLRGDVSFSEPGVYTVKWTVVASDGDEQLGYFDFTISDGVPVTALARPDGPIRSALTPIGTLLLAAGLILLARRRPSE
jgi:methionine-rich copper-binding protein CopC